MLETELSQARSILSTVHQREKSLGAEVGVSCDSNGQNLNAFFCSGGSITNRSSVGGVTGNINGSSNCYLGAEVFSSSRVGKGIEQVYCYLF